MTKSNLSKAVLMALGGAMASVSMQASATAMASAQADLSGFVGNAAGYTTQDRIVPNVWDGGSVGYGNTGASDCSTNDCGNLPTATGARIGGRNPDDGSVQNSRNWGWNHLIKWRVFQITTVGGYTISVDRAAGGSAMQPAFTLWSSGGAPWSAEGFSHTFNQVTGPDPAAGNGYLSAGANPITGFVGYANSGNAFINGGGNPVLGALAAGSSTQGPLYDASKAYGANVNPASSALPLPPPVKNFYTSVVTKGAYVDPHAGTVDAAFRGGNYDLANDVHTSDGHADFSAWLTPGWYVIAAGGSCQDFTCTPTYNVDPVSGYRSVPTGEITYTILPNATVTAPVPLPAAIWLLGSALAGMGIGGRRKGKAADC